MPGPTSEAPLEDQTTEFGSRARLDSWTAPLARALHYGAVERLADAYHGWRDGRRALPIVVEAGEREDRAAMSTTGPPSAPPSLLLAETPWTNELRRAAATRIGEEKVDHEREMAVLFSSFTTSLTRLGAAVDLVEQTRLCLDEASKPIEATALNERRLAERDEAGRPESLIRARRREEHRRKLDDALAANEKVEERFGRVLAEVLVLSDLMRRREEVTRIRMERIREHTWRRISAYWRTLVRVHPRGAEVNARIVPIGPHLPRWAATERDPDGLTTTVGPE